MEVIVRPQGPVKFLVEGDQSAKIQVEEARPTIRIVQSASPLPVSGSGGASARFSWTPPSAQEIWMIPHNLGFKPQVTVMDVSGEVVHGNVNYLDLNTLTVSFTVPFYGTAQLG